MKNKKFNILLFMLITLVISCDRVFAESYEINYDNLCANFAEGVGSAVRMIGYIVEIVKIVIPLLIIVYGMVDFGKAVISSDDKAINKATNSLIRRIVAGIAVFFIPTIILAMFNIIGITNDIENTSRYSACTKCILNASEYCPLD